MGLNIAILGFNYDLTCRALQGIAENDMDSKPKIRKRNQVIMEDGTRYIAIQANDSSRGIRLDQLIIADDYRWMVLDEYKDFIDTCIIPCLSNPYIPEEFIIQKYEY